MTEPPAYTSPLVTRYASSAMLGLWTAAHRARVWRELWLALAEAQRELGLSIPEQAITEMRGALDAADLGEIRRYEERLRHDVMAHIHHFGDQAPAARPFLHLGATSAFVTDNADLLIIRAASRLLLGRLYAVLRALADFAHRHRAVATVAYTHFQPAQLTTVGKRAALWLQDFQLDAEALRDLVDWLPFRGCKGTTGTQASYLELFGGDHANVEALDRRLAAAFGFTGAIPVSGQTYPRKIDSRIVDTLGGIGQSGAKFGTDLRLLQHEGEVLEPREPHQVGSSAMPYKRNPVRAERVCSLARWILSQQANAHHTAATQWLERSLDDSANRRLVMPETFLATDAVLVLCANIAAGLEVDAVTVRRHVERHVPFIATERWLMLAVQAGGDRQHLHEVIGAHSRAVAEVVAAGGDNDLLERLAGDPAFAEVDAAALRAELEPARYVGRAPEQVETFLDGPLRRTLERLADFAVDDDVRITV